MEDGTTMYVMMVIDLDTHEVSYYKAKAVDTASAVAGRVEITQEEYITLMEGVCHK